MKHFTHAVAASVFGLALVGAGSSAFAQSGNEWTNYGGDYANTRYSTLDQINTGNVSKLKVAWIHSMGSLETQEASPLIVGDTMYVSSSTGPKHVFALNAKTGKMKWKHDPELPADFMATVCCGLDSGPRYNEWNIGAERTIRLRVKRQPIAASARQPSKSPRRVMATRC